MSKFGLALSGGGFRGTLYHLGVVRFLRDAGLLRNVTHITSVSGGSILAAHLVLNWDRYNGTPEEFEGAAREILDFAQIDVRNRIVRRFPLLVFGQVLRWLTRKSFDRRFTRTGLLEHYYRKHLYGDTCLYELPYEPELHILSTNLSEGCIGSFTRTGLIMERRRGGDQFEFERNQTCLATVPLAVASSSAFPGFFPPLVIQAAEIGANKSAVSLMTFTDGGVFDNLGIRAFRFIQRCWAQDCKDSEAGEPAKKHRSHDRRGHETPAHHHHDHGGGSHQELIRRADLERYRDATAAQVMDARDDDDNDDNAFDREANDGNDIKGLGPTSAIGFDAVIASDAGAKLSTLHDRFNGGLIRTALRASDILMDRVWQLEKEIFGATPGFLFAPIHRVIERDDDPHALLPVVQRQVIGIRTDLDRFSRSEIRSLVQHGYCVVRQTCKTRPELFGDDLPDGPPWDPYPHVHTGSQPTAPPGRPNRPPSEPTVLARELQASAFRQIVSTLFDWRDSMTYLFLPFVAFLILSVPGLLLWFFIHVHRDSEALQTISAGNPDEAKLIELVREGTPHSMEGMPYEEVDHFEAPDSRGFLILSDAHIVDMRTHGEIYQYRHFLIRREHAKATNDHLRIQFASAATHFSLRCQNSELYPTLKRIRPGTPAEQEPGALHRYELDLDFREVAPDVAVDLIVDGLFWGHLDANRSVSQFLPHTIHGDTKVTTMWMLYPHHRRPTGQFELVATKPGHSGVERLVQPTREFEALGGVVHGWQIIGPDADTTYEGHWVLK